MTTDRKHDPGVREVERVVEELIFQHLVDLIDVDRLGVLQRCVEDQVLELHERQQLDTSSEGEARERAQQIVERAWRRVIDGLAEASRPWEPDEDCALCQLLARAEPTQPGPPRGGAS
jgi:hypothetical protein